MLMKSLRLFFYYLMLSVFYFIIFIDFMLILKIDSLRIRSKLLIIHLFIKIQTFHECCCLVSTDRLKLFSSSHLPNHFPLHTVAMDTYL